MATYLRDENILFTATLGHLGKAIHIRSHMKGIGYLKGVPDLLIFEPAVKHGYHGLVIEMKRKDKGYASKDQVEVLERFTQRGWLAKVCYGHEEAIETVKFYMKGVVSTYADNRQCPSPTLSSTLKSLQLKELLGKPPSPHN